MHSFAERMHPSTLASRPLACLCLCVTVLHPCAMQALSSPVGAAILAKLDSKRVELVMGSALLVIIVAEQASKLFTKHRKQRSNSLQARHQHQRPQETQDSSTAPGGHAAADVMGSSYSSSYSSIYSGSPFECSLSPRRASPHRPFLDSQESAAAAAADCTVCLPDGSSTPSRVRDKQRSGPDRVGDDQDLQHSAVVTFGDVAGPWPDDQDRPLPDREQQPLLPDHSSGAHDIGCTAAAGASNNINSSSSGSQPDSGDSSHPGDTVAVGRHRRCWQAVRPWRVVLGIGSIVGTLSGVMEGLTGESALNTLAQVFSCSPIPADTAAGCCAQACDRYQNTFLGKHSSCEL